MEQLVQKFTNARLLRDGKLVDDNFWIAGSKIIDPQVGCAT